MKPSKHTARIGLVYASQKDMAARIAYRAEPCDLARDVRCFTFSGVGIIWKKVDLSAPESRVDVKDGIDKWERSVAYE